MTKCDPLGTAPCTDDGLPSPRTLHRGCVSDSSYSGGGWCDELSPTASGSGGACSFEIVDVDLLSHCADRLWCVDPSGTGTNGSCVGYCSTQTCSDSTAPCSTCLPAGDACKPSGTGFVGYCEKP
jgi:hypothetical protein